jgi:hypothetical protein
MGAMFHDVGQWLGARLASVAEADEDEILFLVDEDELAIGVAKLP